MKGSEVALLAGGAILLLLVMNRSAAPPGPVYIRTSAPSGAGLTAAEIAAGGTVASTLLDDLFGDNGSPASSGAAYQAAGDNSYS